MSSARDLFSEQDLYLLDNFGLPAEDAVDGRRYLDLGLCAADWAAVQGRIMVQEKKLGRLERDLRRQQQGRPPLQDPPESAHAVWARGSDFALSCVLPLSRFPNGIVEAAIVAARTATGFWPRCGDVPVLIECGYGFGSYESKQWFYNAINEPSPDRSHVYICDTDVMEQILEIEIPDSPVQWPNGLDDRRVWVSAEAQAIGLLAERWDMWTRLRACKFTKEATG